MNAPISRDLFGPRATADQLFHTHLSGRLRSYKTIYAAHLRNAYDAERINEADFVRFCKFLESPYDIRKYPDVERFFLDSVWSSDLKHSSGIPASETEVSFLRSASEWTLLRVMAKDVRDSVRYRVLHALVPHTDDEIREFRAEIRLSVDTLLKHEFRPNLRDIPAETFHLLSDEGVRYAWEKTRDPKSRRGADAFDTKLLHHSQNEILSSRIAESFKTEGSITE